MTWRIMIGKKIREAMRAKGLSQSELARRLGIKPQAVNAWIREKNPTTPRHSRVSSIARVLGVGETSLYGSEPTEPAEMSGVDEIPAQQLLQRIMGAAPRLDKRGLAVLKAYVDALQLMQESDEEAKGKPQAHKK